MNQLHIIQSAVALVLAQDVAAETSRRSLMEYIQSGGPVGYVIIAMSVAAVGLWIMLAIELRLPRLAPPEAVDAIGRYFREGNTMEALRYCQRPENNCFLTRVFAGALLRASRSQLGMLELRSALEESGKRQVERLYRMTDWVALIAAVGPMLGLLGTVFGMIGAFGSIGRLEGAARHKELADFMSLALVATAMGLLVAIPCTAAYAIFRRRIEGLADRAGELSEGLVLELEAPKAAPRAARPAAVPAAAPRPAPEPVREARVS